MAVSADQTLRKLDNRLKINPSSRVFPLAAEYCFQRKDFTRAIEICLSGLRLYPDSLTGHIILGKCYLAQEKLQEASQEFLSVVTRDRKNQAALSMLAEIYSRQGKNDIAGDIYAYLLAADPDNALVMRLSAVFPGTSKNIFETLALQPKENKNDSAEAEKYSLGSMDIFNFVDSESVLTQTTDALQHTLPPESVYPPLKTAVEQKIDDSFVLPSLSGTSDFILSDAAPASAHSETNQHFNELRQSSDIAALPEKRSEQPAPDNAITGPQTAVKPQDVPHPVIQEISNIISNVFVMPDDTMQEIIPGPEAETSESDAWFFSLESDMPSQTVVPESIQPIPVVEDLHLEEPDDTSENNPEATPDTSIPLSDPDAASADPNDNQEPSVKVPETDSEFVLKDDDIPASKSAIVAYLDAAGMPRPVAAAPAIVPNDVNASESVADENDCPALEPHCAIPVVKKVPPEPAALVSKRVPEELDEIAQEKRQQYSIPDHVLTPTLAEIYLQQGQTQVAIQIYVRLLIRDPANTRLSLRLEEIKQITAAEESDPFGNTKQAAVHSKSLQDKRPLAGVRIKKEIKAKLKDKN